MSSPKGGIFYLNMSATLVLGALIRPPFPLFSVIADTVHPNVETLYNRNNTKRAPFRPGRASPSRRLVSYKESLNS